MNSPQEVIPEFRMSAFAALMGLRQYLRDHPDAPIKEAVISLQRSADLSAADFNGALRLHERFPVDIDFSHPATGLRAGLSILINAYRPWWLRFFPYGRQRLATALTPDEFQTFRSAGLFEPNPPLEVIEWWDSLANLIRATEDAHLNAQGRHAERLSLEHERQRLKNLGLSAEPRWIALEDNSAGYDLLSFEQTSYGLRNLLIEVKSSQRSPPRMILTRGEWTAAVQYGSAYKFHLWQFPSEELTILRVEDIAPNVPQDNGKGCWTELEIQF